MATVLIAGLGNVGSHIAQHLARMDDINRLILVDRDSYEQKNLSNQFITASDLGRPKAVAQSERLESISVNNNLRIEAIVGEMHTLFLESLKGCHVLLGCFDNNAARQIAAEISWRLGIVYIDAGVKREGLLARVDVYIPGGKEAPCIECGWTQADYERLEMQYPCNKKGVRQPTVTDSPSYLGALAASLQAAECAKILSGNLSAAGSRIVASAHSYKYYISRLSVNTRCRFDHKTWNSKRREDASSTLSVLEFLDRGNDDAGESQ